MLTRLKHCSNIFFFSPCGATILYVAKQNSAKEDECYAFSNIRRLFNNIFMAIGKLFK